MRGWPSWKTSSTAVWATTEPKATMPTISMPSADVVVLQRHRERLGLLGRQLADKRSERDDARQHRGDDDVDDRADRRASR